MFASCRHRKRSGFGGRCQTEHGDRPRLGAAVETDSASGEVVAGVTRRMHAVMTEFRREFETFWRARLYTQPASFALFDIDCDLAARWARHVGHLIFDLYLVAAVCVACGYQFVFSQYSYSSARKWGWAISISALARSRIDLPGRYATPNSATT